MSVRSAGPDDAAALARLINAAFVVEAFFKIGDRTSADEVAALMAAGGEFIVLDAPAPGIGIGTRTRTGTGTGTGTQSFLGCAYLKSSGDRAYFGMLSVDPRRQGQGAGRQLVNEVESRARERGCRFMDIHIVNLREELFPFYRRLGYVESGTLPFSEPERASKSCFFIVMTKQL